MERRIKAYVRCEDVPLASINSQRDDVAIPNMKLHRSRDMPGLHAFNTAMLLNALHKEMVGVTLKS